MKSFVLKFKVKTFLFIVLFLILFLTIAISFKDNIAAVNSNIKKLPIYSVETDEKVAALGFNCAWDNEDIPELIKILDENAVKATFFVSGSWCKKYPESVKALYDAGHEIGSHSNTHADLAKLSKDKIVKEIEMCNDKIEKITGEKPVLFRMPSGSYNNLVIDTIYEYGMIPIQWDCDSIDYQNPALDTMLERTVGKMREGSIMLFHSGAQNTPGALPYIIKGIRDKGFEITVISDIIHSPPYKIDYEGRQHKQ